MQSADARLFIPRSSATAKSERDHSLSPGDPVEKSTRGDAASESLTQDGDGTADVPWHSRHDLRSEMLAAGSIHMLLNDMVRRAAVLDGYDQETTQFILDAVQRFWPFRYEDELDAIRSFACTASSESEGRRSCSTPASATTEASFQTAASCLPADGDLDRLGSDAPDDGETASKGTYACHADDAARASSRDHTEG